MNNLQKTLDHAQILRRLFDTGCGGRLWCYGGVPAKRDGLVFIGFSISLYKTLIKTLYKITKSR